ncbi:MAG TPA: T9SS type A sorting domain-containing protein [candidate division WOR-3 bacterium]|uniref:T9SS type A sorting domain-containing protein n=1 Tax=candidate division WOR-3 bacterium TaxID=2052148 RepID=A0A9C9ENB3_UNCW3|nr:T9SS type A sorting domain-containing protein [candidate division WOR-3 bacterium]
MMKRLVLKLPLFFLLVFYRISSADLIYELPIGGLRYDIVKVEGFDRIEITGSVSTSAPGAPELPVVTFNYLLPRKRKVSSVEIIEEEWDELPGDFYIYPAQNRGSMLDEYAFTPCDPFIYNSETPYPVDIVCSVHSGNMRGYQVCQVGVVPFRYFPESRKLHILKKLKVRFKTEENDCYVIPERQTRTAQELTDRFVSSLIVNKEELNDPSKRPRIGVEDNIRDLTVTDLPALLGAPVDLVVVTTDQLYDVYNKFAHYKKLCGYNTVVRTLTWIRQHYQGTDDAERIRNFLKDAVTKWGVVYVLLGGDVPEIPTRWIWMSSLYNQWPVHIVTDLYFSDLDGTWNQNGNEKFGEVEDSLDLYPDVFVGRLPTRDAFEVNDYLNKVRSYLQPVFTAIQNKALFFTSDLDVSNDAYFMAKRIAEHLPVWFDTTFLNERPKQELYDSLYTGFGIVCGIGHGDINNIRVKNNPREQADIYFFDDLHNTDLYGVLFVITCYTNTFQSDCLSKHWLLNPHGGGVAYIGPTSFSEAYIHEVYTTSQFDSLFSFPLSAVLGRTKVPFISQSQWDNWYRLYQFSISLLGDPTLSLWDTIPLNYSDVTVVPDTLNVGNDVVRLSVNPPQPSTVVFYKENETFIIDTIYDGFLERAVKTETPGYLKYRIQDIPAASRSAGYIPWIDSVFVASGQSHLVYKEHTIVDTSHNSNGMVNPGEDILLYLTIQNTGGAAAHNITARIDCADSLLTMVCDTASFPDIEAAEFGENITPFHFYVSGSLPDFYSLDFEIDITSDFDLTRDSFQIICAAPVMEHFTQRAFKSGDTIEILPYLANFGHEPADSVYGVITADSDTVTILDSLVSFPLIPFNSVVNSEEPFEILLNYPGVPLEFNLEIYFRNEKVITQSVVIDTPMVPESLRVFGRKNSVELVWLQVPGAIGYRVYRATQYNGDYRLLNNYLEPTSRFEDFNVQHNTTYFYYVVAVDSSRNQSASSDTVSGRINIPPAPGWPRPVYDYLFSSCNFADIDPYYPGLEIVVCGKEGYVYAWHYDGSAVLDDGVLFDIHPAEVWTSPALGDLDGDGTIEIVFGVRRSTDNLYVVDNQGVCPFGWPRSVPGNIIGSPVLADIDQDGDLEIFIWTLNADLYAFHHDGTGVFSSNGLLKDLPGISLGSPAIGDINQNGSLEIVCCGGSRGDSLYVWDSSGNYLSPFPIFIQPGNLQYSTVLGDLFGDARFEICFYADSTERLYVVDADGSIRWYQTLYSVADIEGSPIICDVTGDGAPEVICGYQTGFAIFDSLGNTLPGFPDSSHDAKLPVAADIDCDGRAEVIVGSADWFLYAYQNDGGQMEGFPMQFNNRIEASPALYDIDNDGRLELMLGADGYKFYVFDLDADTPAQWPKFRYDSYNSGTYQSGNLNVSSFDDGTAAPLLQLYPIPFKSRLQIKFNDFSGAEEFKLKIYDVTGRLIKSIDCPVEDQNRSFVWSGDDNEGRNVAAGVYFVRVEASSGDITQKVVRVR